MKTWTIFSVIYVSFFLWYTDLGGKLSPEEIQSFMQKYEENLLNDGVSLDSEQHQLQSKFIRKFMEEDTGKQFIMVNSVELNSNPRNVDGANPGESAEELLSRYMEHMWPNLFKRASHPIFAGDAIWESMDIVGIEGAQTWDQAALMRYKSRRAFMEIVTHPNMRDRHRFKVAAMKKTIAYPVEPLGYFSDMRIILAMVLLITCLSIQLFFSSRK